MRFFTTLLLIIFSSAIFASGATTMAKIDFDPISKFENSTDELGFDDRSKVSYTFEWFCNDGESDSSVKEHLVQTNDRSEAYIPLTPMDRFCYYKYRGSYEKVPGSWSKWFVKQFTASDDVRILSAGRIESVTAL